MRGQYQDAWVEGLVLEAGNDFKAVQLGNANVEDDQVRFQLAYQVNGIDAVLGLTDHVQLLALKQHSDRKADYRVVVDY
ncbi:hypothetical protein D3C81_2142490 [compost metagenome]